MASSPTRTREGSPSVAATRSGDGCRECGTPRKRAADDRADALALPAGRRTGLCHPLGTPTRERTVWPIRLAAHELEASVGIDLRPRGYAFTKKDPFDLIERLF